MKLKLCPFCGSSASLQKDQFYRDLYYILCNGCLAKTEQVASAALAAADWNSRFTLELDKPCGLYELVSLKSRWHHSDNIHQLRSALWVKLKSTV